MITPLDIITYYIIIITVTIFSSKSGYCLLFCYILAAIDAIHRNKQGLLHLIFECFPGQQG